jgi:DNA-binding LytR/AlgR family response regulator
MTGHIEGLIDALRVEYYDYIGIETSIYFDGDAFCRRQNTSGELYDIVLMDIVLGTVTGIDAGKRLRACIANDHTIIFFVSAYQTCFNEMIDLGAAGFISKPISTVDFNIRLRSAIDKVIRFRQLPHHPDFAYKKNGQNTYIPKQTIMYVQSNARQVQIQTTFGSHIYYGKLDDEERKLNSVSFVRIHKSFLINLNYAVKVGFDEVMMRDGQTLHVSNSYREKLKAAYLRYRAFGYTGMYDAVGSIMNKR